MEVSFRDVIIKITQLNAIHRYYIHKSVPPGVYFGQPPILEYLSKNESCTQKELADHLSVSPPSVAMSIKRMQKAGLVDKSADSSDLRYNRISLTEKGREMSVCCQKEFHKIDSRMFEGFSEPEIEQLCGYITRMTNNLNTDNISGRDVFEFFMSEH